MKLGGSGLPAWLTADPFRQARRDVRVSMQPQLNEWDQQSLQGQQQLQQNQSRVGNIYGAFAKQLKPLVPQYQRQVQDISQNLTNQLGQFTGMLGSSSPAGELAAAGGLYGTLGAGGLEALASDASRNAAYGASVARQGAEEGTLMQQKYLQDYANQQQAIDQQRQQLFAQMPMQVRSRLDALRQQQYEDILAKRELALRKLLGLSQVELSQKQLNNDSSYNQAVNAALAELYGGTKGRRTKKTKTAKRVGPHYYGGKPLP